MSQKTEKAMPRVKITAPIVGICHMQVCAVADATDEEILAECNRGNPSGTSNGWSNVIRENNPSSEQRDGAKLNPVLCSGHPGRLHFLVRC